MEPVGLFIFLIFGILLLLAVIVPQIQKRRENQSE